MTLYDNTPKGQTERISFEIDLNHSPEKVWRALTDPDLLTQWLLPVMNHRLETGAAFTFTAPPQPGWDGVVHCRMLEIDAPKRISWRWVVGDIDTVVTFTLAHTESGTRLSLVHSGFKPDQKKNFAGAIYGWKMMGGKLVEVLGGMP